MCGAGAGRNGLVKYVLLQGAPSIDGGEAGGVREEHGPTLDVQLNLSSARRTAMLDARQPSQQQTGDHNLATRGLILHTKLHSKSPQFGRLWSNFGRNGSHFRLLRGESGECQANPGRCRPKFGRIRAYNGPAWAKPGEPWSTSAGIVEILAIFGPESTNLAVCKFWGGLA